MLPPTKNPGRGPMKKMMFAALMLAPVMVFGANAQNAAADGIPTAREIAPKMPAPVAPFEWAYPVTPPGARPEINDVPPHPPGPDPSVSFPNRQIVAAFGPPDWFPKEHAPLPAIVAHGQK